MSIDIKNLSQVPASRTGDASRARPNEDIKSNSGDSSASASAGDKLTLTGTAQELVAQLRQSIDNATPVDQQKVESIREKLANDTYQIDSLRLAENFLRKEGALSD